MEESQVEITGHVGNINHAYTRHGVPVMLFWGIISNGAQKVLDIMGII